MEYVESIKRFRNEYPQFGLVQAKRMIDRYGSYEAAKAAVGDDTELLRQGELVELRGRVRDLEAALRAIEAHHVEQNRIKGRDEGRSTTLRLVREQLR